MLTRVYQQRFGPTFEGAMHANHDRDKGLPHGAVTIAEVLKTQGYATVCFGKWHPGYQPPWLPRCSFSEHCGNGLNYLWYCRGVH